MMFITSIVSRILQSVEWFRSGFGKWFKLFFDHCILFKVFTLPLAIFGMIRFFIGLFGSLCDRVRAYFQSINFSGVQVGGVDVLALANSVLPLDELIALVIVWFSVVAVVASIKFIRAAWSAIPFKAS